MVLRPGICDTASSAECRAGVRARHSASMIIDLTAGTTEATGHGRDRLIASVIPLVPPDYADGRERPPKLLQEICEVRTRMNCPQCQTVNGPDAGFCGNCGTRLAPAGAGAQMSAPAAPAGYGAQGSPAGYGAAPGYGNPAGYGNQAGYGGPASNDAPPGYAPPPPGYGPPGGQAPNGYPQGQYQPGQSGPYTQRSSGLPPVNFDLNRLTKA